MTTPFLHISSNAQIAVDRILKMLKEANHSDVAQKNNNTKGKHSVKSLFAESDQKNTDVRNRAM